MILFVRCLQTKQSEDGLISFDVRKKYLEKEVILTDIADITYLHLNTDDENYFYKGSINCITENKLVVLS